MDTAFKAEYESVAVSSRIRLARNFKDYPFPARLARDPHALEQASEMVRLLAEGLNGIEEFRLYELSDLPDDKATVLAERSLISRDLLRNKKISAVLISKDESISIMINEEDHVREQYFMKGYDLRRAYERLSGIDDIIADCIPFAYDETLGYLTACPSNVGTGLRASVMLFLPALARRGRVRPLIPTLTRLGMTVRGVFGEGSGAEGDLFQISNEITLGVSETELLDGVDKAVSIIVEMELMERARMKAEEGLALKDKIFRSYGVLAHSCLLDEKELMRRISDLKLGLALGYFGETEGRDERMDDLDALAVALRPAGIDRMGGTDLDDEAKNALRAEYCSKALKSMGLF